MEKTAKRITIAICGIRGIPACYGGFETFAEELAPRLKALGYEVVVYGRSHVIKYDQPFYKGARIRLHWAPQHKYLETPVHTMLSFIDIVRKKDIDGILLCNAANSPFIIIPRIFGIPVIVNVDGIERLRSKWNILGRWWYRIGEVASILLAKVIVADADAISDYYKKTYRASSEVIRYGFSEERLTRTEQRLFSSNSLFKIVPQIYTQFGLSQGNYFLYVSRLEPENNAHIVIQAYKELPKELRESYPLVVVGDAPYSDQYKAYLRSLIDGDNVIMTGYQFGQAYEDLQLGATVYVQASEVGGTHPALVEALGFGNAVVANDTPEHREVVGDVGFYYEKNDPRSLTAVLNQILLDEPLRKQHQIQAWKWIKEHYNWDRITSDYSRLIEKVTATPS